MNDKARSFVQSYVWPIDFTVAPIPNPQGGGMYRVLVQHDLGERYPVVVIWQDGQMVSQWVAGPITSVDENSLLVGFNFQSDDNTQYPQQTLTVRVVG